MTALNTEEKSGGVGQQLPMFLTEAERDHLRSGDFHGDRMDTVDAGRMSIEYGHNYASGARGDSENAFEHVSKLKKIGLDKLPSIKATLSGVKDYKDALLTDGHHRVVASRGTGALSAVQWYDNPGAAKLNLSGE